MITFKTPVLFFCIFSFFICIHAQDSGNKIFPTRQDTLKGSNTVEKAWWDVQYYNISIDLDYRTRTISGSNTIFYKVIKTPHPDAIQIDLLRPLQIDSIIQNNDRLQFYCEGNACFININKHEQSTGQITIHYSGKPKQSLNPPWDGGFVWTADSIGRPWISVACQLLGASAWYPCKVNVNDEPDNGASLTVTVADTLIVVGNGLLKGKKRNADSTISYTWSIVNPINNYGISFYAGKYNNMKEIYNGEKGKLNIDYWVLDYNTGKFDYLSTEVVKIIKTFEYWFGPYPFYEDGFKIVEAPYVGMEHQSAIAYGNNFQWGRIKFGNLSYWDYKTDRLLVHETAHEWFGNNISTKDITDRWIHEGFAGFAEELFIEAQYGRSAAQEFFIARTKKRISNKGPVIQRYGIFEDAGSDMYLKGWVLIHMIRAIINDDAKFRNILRGLNEKFYHLTITSQQVEEFINKSSGIDFSLLFNQYLRVAAIPVLEYELEGNFFKYRFTDCVKNFTMPLKTNWTGDNWITPTTGWQKHKVMRPGDSLAVNPNFYLITKKASK